MATKKKTSLTDLAIRQQVYLERIKSGFIRDWQPAQENLRRRIREVLTALEVETMQDLDRRALNRVLVELREAHMGVTAKAMEGFVEKLPGLADYAAKLEASTLGNLTERVFNAPTAKLAYQAAINNPVQATGQMMLKMIRNWPEADAVRVANLVQKGWAQNLPLMDMVRAATGTKANNYEDGFLEQSRQHAGTVINTATQHTANAARMDVWERNNDIIDGYEFVATLDRRTTAICRSLDGRVFEAGKGPVPPLHPNCRSTTVAKLSKEFAFLEEGATRASSGPNPGYVSADETYYTWLKRQPAAFQDLAIGPKRGQLFREGGLTEARFGELNLSRNFEPLTLEQMKAIEPEAFKRAGLN